MWENPIKERYFHINHDHTEFAVNRKLELLSRFRGPSKPLPQNVSYWRSLESDVNGRLPEGVSVWGKKVLACILDDKFMLTREHLCEEIRQAEFLNYPSRLQSLFCCGTLDEARDYRREWGQLAAPIWAVKSDSVFRADMRWMSRCEEHELRPRIRNYWSGETTSQPSWDYLLVNTVTILECVDDGKSGDAAT